MIKIFSTIKEKLKLTCVAFTILTLFFGSIGFAMAWDSFTPKAIFLNFAVAFFFGFGTVVFEIKILNNIAKHILYFIIVYSSFIIIQGIIIRGTNKPLQVLILTIFFVIIYSLILVVKILTKNIINKFKNEKQDYKNVFKK